MESGYPSFAVLLRQGFEGFGLRRTGRDGCLNRSLGDGRDDSRYIGMSLCSKLMLEAGEKMGRGEFYEFFCDCDDVHNIFSGNAVQIKPYLFVIEFTITVYFIYKVS